MRINKSLEPHLFRLGICLVVFCGLYVAFVVLPSQQRTSEEALSTKQQQFIETLYEIDLLRGSLASLQPGPSDAFNDALAISNRLAEVNRQLDLVQSDDQTLPLSEDEYNVLTSSTRRTYLEYVGFSNFTDSLLEYNVVADTHPKYGYSDEELRKKKAATVSALEQFQSTTKTYTANSSYQLPDGSVVTVLSVNSFTLSSASLDAVENTKRCILAADPSTVYLCEESYGEIKAALISQLSDILQSKHNPQAVVQIKPLIDKIKAE